MTGQGNSQRPLQNRVLPDGQIVVSSMRGSLMGNRGGKIHDPKTKRLLSRRWASKRWISCVLQFKNRHREVMGNGYTELFFLDEIAALSAGHRPCFECQRKRANFFAEIWERVFSFEAGSKADQMDRVLHAARTTNSPEFVSPESLLQLPVGAMVATINQGNNSNYFAKHTSGWLRYSCDGYRAAGNLEFEAIRLITPSPILKLLEQGYEPIWHKSADSATGANIIGAK